MHVLIVHQNFAEPDNPGGTRHFELACQLVQAGHRCTVVAGSVDFVTGKPVSRTPSQRDGVAIRRAYALPTINHSYLGRSMSYLSFMVTSVWEGWRAGPVDVVIGTSPPLFQLPSAWMLSRLRRRPFVLEVRDLWPDFAVDTGVLRNPVLIGLARLVERFFYRHNEGVVINSPGFRDHLEQSGVASSQITVIPNGVDTGQFDPERRCAALREQWGAEDRCVALYAGSFGQSNDLGTLLRAAEQLRDNPRVLIVLAGGGKDKAALESMVAERQLDNVRFAGSFPKSEMPDVLSAADVCVATLRNVRMFRTVYPNKVFDYMAAGRPTVLAIDGVIRDVVESADGGTYVQPGDPDALAAAIAGYAEDPERCRQHGHAGAGLCHRAL